MNKGFTLLEAVIAIALWMVLALGLFFLWQNIAAGSFRLTERQSAFENARIAMDGILTNVQLAKEVNILTFSNNSLRVLTLTQLNPDGILQPYAFRINRHVAENSPNRHRLIFNNVEFASGIRMVYITHTEGSHLDIVVETACDPPLVLRGSVDVRYKKVTSG